MDLVVAIVGCFDVDVGGFCGIIGMILAYSIVGGLMASIL